MTHWDSTLREVRLARFSPVHHASVLPYAYFTLSPQHDNWSPERLLRPSKYLLRLGFNGDIPEQVGTRNKNSNDAVISKYWLHAGVGWMPAAAKPVDTHPGYAKRTASSAAAELGCAFDAGDDYWPRLLAQSHVESGGAARATQSAATITVQVLRH